MTPTPENLLDLARDVIGVSREEWERLGGIMKDDAAMNRVMKREWENQPRSSEATIRDYYRQSNIWFVNSFTHGVQGLCSLGNRNPFGLVDWRTRVRDFLPLGGPGLLDYGGGMLNDSWPFAAAGFKVTVAEVKGPTTKFLLAYRKLFGLELAFDVIEVDSDRPVTGMYDGVICMETLEHVLEPEALTSHLCDHLNPGKPFAYSVSFGNPEHAPYHVASNVHLAGAGVWPARLRKIGLEPFWDVQESHQKIWRKP